MGREENPELSQVNQYLDCGIYVALYIYKLLIEPRTTGQGELEDN